MATDTPQQIQSSQTDAAQNPVSAGDPIVLNTPEGARIIIQDLNDAIADGDRVDTLNIIHAVSRLLKDKYPQLKQEQPKLYQEIDHALAHAQWFVLNALNPEDLEKLFAEHLEEFFEYDWQLVRDDVKNMLHASVSLWEDRDLWKQKYRQALSRSQYHIGDKSIRIAEQVVDPTVENWLRDWKEFIGDHEIDPLLIVEYLNKSENVKQLSTQDREKLDHLLKFDHALNLSSLEAEGTEEIIFLEDAVDGTYKIFDKGELIKTDVAIPEEELKALRYVYGLNDQGKPMSVSERVRTSPIYMQPVQVPGGSTADTAAPLPPETSPAQQNLSVPPSPPAPSAEPSPAPVVPASVTPSPPAAQPLKPKRVRKAQTATPPPAPDIPAPTPQPKKKRAKKASAPLVPPSTNMVDVSVIARRVLNTHKILFNSLDSEKRFLSAIAAYLKQTRDNAQTREILSRPTEEGGVNLPMQQIDELLRTADTLYAQALQNPTPSATAVPTIDADHYVPTLEAVEKQIHAHAADHPEAQSTGPAPLEDIFANVNPIFDAPQSQTQSQHEHTPVMAPAIPPQSQSSTTGQPEAPQVMGPIDELRAMNLIEFRRLSTNPTSAAQKIVQKINLLEQDSIAKKVDGMDAWHVSPLNRMYIQIGSMSLEQSISIPDAIAQYSTQHKEALTQAEFEAIADLNRQIRY